jgi:methyl-accepting chemotaxis protein
MKKKRASLAFQILVLCLNPVILVSLVLSAINRIAGANLRSTAEITMRYLNMDIQHALAPFLEMVNNGATVFHTLPSVETKRAALVQIVTSVPDAFEMYYGTVISRHAPGGYIVFASGWSPPQDWDAPQRLWFIDAGKHPDTTVITDPYVDSQTGRACITVARNVRDEEGNITGVIAVDMFVDVLNDIVSQRKITEDGNTVLIDRSGLYIVHSNPEYIMNKSIFDDIGDLNKGKILTNETTVSFNGNNYICFAPVSGTNWFLVSAVNDAIELIRQDISRENGSISQNESSVTQVTAEIERLDGKIREQSGNHRPAGKKFRGRPVVSAKTDPGDR